MRTGKFISNQYKQGIESQGASLSGPSGESHPADEGRVRPASGKPASVKPASGKSGAQADGSGGKPAKTADAQSAARPRSPLQSSSGGSGEKAERRRKLQKLRALGVDPYPHVCREAPKGRGILHGSAAIRRAAPSFRLEEPAASQTKKPSSPPGGPAARCDASGGPAPRSKASGGPEAVLTGRIRLKRDMGKAAFFNVQDENGSFQCYIRKDDFQPQEAPSPAKAAAPIAEPASDKEASAAPSPWEIWRLSDIGDIVWLRGLVFHTRRGELSLRVKDFQMLCKALEPLPEKHHGLEDKELKYRFRHLDLITDPASREIFKTRSRIIHEIRTFMHRKGFMEAETPVLQPIYGGAAALPFITRHRRLKRDLYLKISPEIYLKKLLVGGFEKVFEIGKNFRNEGIDRSHSPEFTMMEYYEAWTDYQYQMDQFEDLVCYVAGKIKGEEQACRAEEGKNKSLGEAASDPQTKTASKTACNKDKTELCPTAGDGGRPPPLKILYQGKEIDFERPWARIRVRDLEDLIARALCLPKTLKQKTEALFEALSSSAGREPDHAGEAANFKDQKSGAGQGAKNRPKAKENFCPTDADFVFPQGSEQQRLWPAVLEELNNWKDRQEIRLIYQGREEGFSEFWGAVQKEMKRQRQKGTLRFPDFWRRLSEEANEEKSAAQKQGIGLSPKEAPGEKSGSLIKEKASSKNPAEETPDDSLSVAAGAGKGAFSCALLQYIKLFCYVKALDSNFDLRGFENPFPALQNRKEDKPFSDRFQDLKNELALTACELTAERFFHDPIFIMDFPVSLSPLTKRLRDSSNGGAEGGERGPAAAQNRRSRLVERFEPYIAGMEIGNAYTELNDPEEQEARLKEQRREGGDAGAIHPVDENFLHALHAGLPPAGGVGLGIERLVMILTDQKNIRDSILFPVLKSQGPGGAESGAV